MSNSKIFTSSIVAAVSGFIFGFDTVVISGANQPIKELWHTTEISPWFHGIFIMSMALWGTVVGALFGGIPTEKYGRKKILLWVGILFALSAVGSALAPGPYSFSFFRFIGGLGIGISSVAAPTYISEISTPATRGRFAALYQFNIVFGILVAFFSNYFLKGVGGVNDWRWMLGVMAIPSVIYTLMVFGVPESPRWLISRRNDIPEAKKILSLMGAADTDAEIAAIIKANEEETAGKQVKFFSPRYNKVIWLAFMVAFFNQLSGINFILYYAPEILQRAGLAAKDSLFNSIAIGGINIIFTFFWLYLIDRLGRKNVADHRLFWLYNQPRNGSLVFSIACRFTFLNDFSFIVHRRPWYWTGCGNMGIHFGDIPQQSTGPRPVIRRQCSLGVCCNNNISNTNFLDEKRKVYLKITHGRYSHSLPV